MFRRPAKPNNAPAPSAPASPAEPGKIISDLLAHPTPEGVLSVVLAQAVELAGGGAKAYAVLSRGEDRVAAVLGYDADLVGAVLSGPWAAGRSRIVGDGAAELFATNPPELRAKLDVLGMREVKSSIVTPLRDRNRFLGAIVVDRYTAEPYTSAQLDAVSRWAAAVTPVLGLLESREEARQLARKLSSVFVESVESLDFDSVGHARRVTETAQKLGRALGMNERDLDELWYATMLHDLGKLHGDEGHALVGANLLHDVPQLVGAQQGVRHHHERWDGFGEPDRLAGEEIPLIARIVAVADAWVRKGNLEALQREAGRILDPRLVASFEALVNSETPTQA